MALFMPTRRAQHKRFDYEPRYYNPKREQDIKHRMQVQRRSRSRKNPAGLIYAAILLIGAIYVYMELG